MNMLINQNHLKETKLENLFDFKATINNDAFNNLIEFNGCGNPQIAFRVMNFFLSERISDEEIGKIL